jgi:hypothetical protein
MPALSASYDEQLAALPGVLSHRVLSPPADRGNDVFDALLVLETKAGSRKLVVRQLKSHVSREMATHVASSHKGPAAVLILAPHVGSGVAATLIERGLNYLDASGNCHISVPPFFVHVEGKSAEKGTGASTGVRGPGFQVLFAYLAEPALLDASIRTVAEVAGVSRQPVLAMKHRLHDDKLILASKTRTQWHPRRREDALALWLQGYQTTVRASLLAGSYRTREQDPNKLDARILDALPTDQFRWGGTAAGYRLTGNYRGERTVVHVRAGIQDLAKKVRSLPDPAGNLLIMNTFGTINWSPERETVHPLLVYSEMLSEGSERAREAAQALHDRYLVPLWRPLDKNTP